MCHDLLWNLLTGNVPDADEDRNISAMTMVSLLDDTKDCDDYIDMSNIRKQYRTFLNHEHEKGDLYDRAVKGQIDSYDEKFKVAKAHILHYCIMERYIRKNLSYRD